MVHKEADVPTNTALFVSAFIDELYRCGVRDVVVSPGSRSTPLAMIAYESDLDVYVDVDERGAAFFALGLAKASCRPVCLICTSGTAGANYYPAIIEAESSRVPLIAITADRPLQLQQFGAPQTCDQVKMFADHVRFFQQMPVSDGSLPDSAFARQAALSAFMHAAGTPASFDDDGRIRYGCWGSAGPVHVNFPFVEPLMPDTEAPGLFTVGRASADMPALVAVPASALIDIPGAVLAILMTKKTIVLAGEGSVANRAEADRLFAWAGMFNLPLLADPLSGLRSFDDEAIIDRYDVAFAQDRCPDFEAVIRFGRYPVSKSCTTGLFRKNPLQIVVDAYDTRDFNHATDVFMRCAPAAFVASCLQQLDVGSTRNDHAYLVEWQEANKCAREHIATALTARPDEEPALVEALLAAMPSESCLFAGNSMAVRYLDLVYAKRDKRIFTYGNRALNGIDGTISSALGAAQCFDHTLALVGDIAFIHDINALALKQELTDHHGGLEKSIVIVVFNNHGGGVFDIVAQRMDSAAYDRLFFTRHELEFSSIVQGFGAAYRAVSTQEELLDAYASLRACAGIGVIEVACVLDGLGNRYASCR